MTLAVKGANVSAWNTSNIGSVLETINLYELDTLTIPVRIAMTDATDSVPLIDQPSLNFALQMYYAVSGSVKVIIEPYPWVANGNVAEMSVDPSDVTAWFSAWETCLDTLIASFPSAWGMYVSSNLINLEAETAKWIAVIDRAKLRFAGQVLYRTNWWVTTTGDTGPGSTTEAYEAKLSNDLFGAVDIIAISAYFEVTSEPNPTYEECLTRLYATDVFGRGQNIVDEVNAFSETWGKPILFGEIGIPARDGGATNPWNPDVSATPNATIQLSLLQAYVRAFSSNPLFYGMSLFVIGHPYTSAYTLEQSAMLYWTSLNAPTGVAPDEPQYTVTTERIYRRIPEFYRTLDRKNNYHLKKYISAMGDVLFEIDLLVARLEYVPPQDRADYYAARNQYNTYYRLAKSMPLYDGEYLYNGDFAYDGVVIPSVNGVLPIGETCDLFDGNTAEVEWLPYIGQAIGADLRQLPLEEEQRDAVTRNYLGFKAGSRQSLEEAAKRLLTGTKFVRVYPHRNGADSSLASIGTKWDMLLVTKPDETPNTTDIIAEIIRKGAKPAGVKLHHITYVATWDALETLFISWGAIENARTWGNIELGNAELLPL